MIALQVYSYAMCLYEVLTGKVPWMPKTIVEVGYMVRVRTFCSPSANLHSVSAPQGRKAAGL